MYLVTSTGYLILWCDAFLFGIINAYSLLDTDLTATYFFTKALLLLRTVSSLRTSKMKESYSVYGS